MNVGGDHFSVEPEEADERSLEDDLRDLAGHARDYAQAEMAFQKSRAAYVGKSALWITIWLCGALVFVFFAIMALVFGAILVLAPLITALGATAAVTGLLLLLALLGGLSALRRWHKMTAVLEGKDAA